MKQLTPLRKKQNYVDTDPYIGRPTPEQLDAQALEPPKQPKQPSDMRTIASGLTAGAGFGFAISASLAIYLGDTQDFIAWTSGIVICLMIYLWLDTDDA